MYLRGKKNTIFGFLNKLIFTINYHDGKGNSVLSTTVLYFIIELSTNLIEWNLDTTPVDCREEKMYL